MSTPSTLSLWDAYDTADCWMALRGTGKREWTATREALLAALRTDAEIVEAARQVVLQTTDGAAEGLCAALDRLGSALAKRDAAVIAQLTGIASAGDGGDR